MTERFIVDDAGTLIDMQTRDMFDIVEEVCPLLNRLSDENEQLKQSSTMYYNLFVELQKQLKGVKKKSDLDHIDFNDLIELSKGNVFDDKLGWIHLPVKELQL